MKYLLLFSALLSLQTLAAEEALKLQGLSVIGDKELPNVLYIIPWKTHKTTQITAPKYTSALDDDFSFINKPIIK